MRRVGQLWFDLLDFSCNLSPEKITKTINDGETNQYIIGMHPHGIVPFQAILWAAYCDLYLSDPVTKRALYGFGAAADVVQYLPFLKNIMAWLSAGSADYKVLFAGLSRVIIIYQLFQFRYLIMCNYNRGNAFVSMLLEELQGICIFFLEESLRFFLLNLEVMQ